jgi:hypothetical protein
MGQVYAAEDTRLERVRDLPRERQRLRNGDRARARCAATVLALDELHHQRGLAVCFFEPVDLRDVWG